MEERYQRSLEEEYTCPECGKKYLAPEELMRCYECADAGDMDSGDWDWRADEDEWIE